MNEPMNPHEFEKILIQYMFKDADVRDKLLPFLTVDVFELDECIDIVKQVLKHQEKYQTFPSTSDMKIRLESKWSSFSEILNIDTSEYDSQFILDQLEEFFRGRLAKDAILEAQRGLEEDDDALYAAPDKLREALSFTFNTNVGLNIVSDVDRMYSALHDKDKVVASGIKSVDRLIEGGFHEKSLTLLLGQANIGKSLILCSLATNSLLQNKNVLYISLEMSEEKISERILANMFDIDLPDLKMLSKDKFYEKLNSSVANIDNNFYVISYPPKSVNSNRIRNILKELLTKKKFVPDIIYVDYLGIMSPNNAKKNSNSYNELKDISEELRAVAVEYSLPVVSAIQTNRQGFGSSDLDMTDIADSIGTAATADIIFGIVQTIEMREAGRYSFQLLKNRYGENSKKCPLGVNYPRMRVFDIEIDETKPKHLNAESDETENLVSNLLKRDKKAGQNKILKYE